jgi:hypothetical protein
VHWDHKGSNPMQIYLSSSKGKGVSAKLELRWSKQMIIAKFLKPNVVQLANAKTGVAVKLMCVN